MEIIAHGVNYMPISVEKKINENAGNHPSNDPLWVTLLKVLSVVFVLFVMFASFASLNPELALILSSMSIVIMIITLSWGHKLPDWMNKGGGGGGYSGPGGAGYTPPGYTPPPPSVQQSHAYYPPSYQYQSGPNSTSFNPTSGQRAVQHMKQTPQQGSKVAFGGDGSSSYVPPSQIQQNPPPPSPQYHASFSSLPPPTQPPQFGSHPVPTPVYVTPQVTPQGGKTQFGSHGTSSSSTSTYVAPTSYQQGSYSSYSASTSPSYQAPQGTKAQFGSHATSSSASTYVTPTPSSNPQYQSPSYSAQASFSSLPPPTQPPQFGSQPVPTPVKTQFGSHSTSSSTSTYVAPTPSHPQGTKTQFGSHANPNDNK